MTSENEVYDADTQEWVTVDPGWVVSEPEPGEDSTPDEETESTVTNCSDLDPPKRHKYKNRDTGEMSELCLVCGSARATPSQKRSTPAVRSGGGKAENALDMLLSGLWMGASFAVRSAVPAPSGPAAGKVMALEASIAGPKLHKVLKKTPLYPYLAIAAGQFGWAYELSSLLLPPILVGLVAARPQLAVQLRPVLIATLVPVLAEAARKAEQQASLLTQLEGFNQKTIDAAGHIIDDLIGVEHDEQSDDA